MENTATVEIPLPLKAECWDCGEIMNLYEIGAVDIIRLAVRSWSCNDCDAADLDEDHE